MLRTTLFMSITALFVFFAVTPASAQQTASPPNQDVPNVEVNENELERVAVAYITVQNITADFRDAVNEAENAEAAKDIQAEYANRANAAVQDEGLTLERYDEVVRAATVDEELRTRLMGEIENQLNDQEGGQ